MKGLLPVKWMAIESLTDWVFSSQSDVWSFGGQSRSLAKVPYGAGLQFAPDEIGQLMADCRKSEPHQRPKFSQLVKALITLLLPTKISQKMRHLNLNCCTNNFKDTMSPFKICKSFKKLHVRVIITAEPLK